MAPETIPEIRHSDPSTATTMVGVTLETRRSDPSVTVAVQIPMQTDIIDLGLLLSLFVIASRDFKFF